MGVPEDDEHDITCDQFMDLYADVSMAVFEEAAFVKLVSDSWKIEEPIQLKVNNKDVEHLVMTLRKQLMKKSSDSHLEETVLR